MQRSRVRHRDRSTDALFLEVVAKRTNARAHGVEVFAALGSVELRVVPVRFAQMRTLGENLHPRQPFPRTKSELSQSCIENRIHSVRYRDCARRLSRAQQIARVDSLEALLAQPRRQPGRLEASFVR